MKYKILHYVSMYNLMALIYLVILYLSMTFFGKNYLTLIITTYLFVVAVRLKILKFSSGWLDRQ